MLSKNQIDPSRLPLEITESSVMDDPDDSIRTFRAIHDLGIKVSIDDFGTGYSSLNYLKRLPISAIKLDKSFMEDVLMNRNTPGNRSRDSLDGGCNGNGCGSGRNRNIRTGQFSFS